MSGIQTSTTGLADGRSSGIRSSCWASVTARSAASALLCLSRIGDVRPEDRLHLGQRRLAARLRQEPAGGNSREAMAEQRPVASGLACCFCHSSQSSLHRLAGAGILLQHHLVEVLGVAEDGLAELVAGRQLGQLGLELQHLGDEHRPRPQAQPPLPGRPRRWLVQIPAARSRRPAATGRPPAAAPRAVRRSEPGHRAGRRPVAGCAPDQGSCRIAATAPDWSGVSQGGPARRSCSK